MTPTFQGEVQFRRWSDSSTQGVQVTFALPDSSELEPLKGLEGKRFMAVLVRIGDDEQPLDPGSDPQKPRRKDTRGPLCREACELCDVPAFLEFAEAETKAEAESFIRSVCAISSRNELDADPLAGDVFKTRIRIPFMRWQRENK